MRFCTNCGNPVSGAPKYCTGCGKQLPLIGEPTAGAGAASGQSRPEAGYEPLGTRPAGPAAAPLRPEEPATAPLTPEEPATAARAGPDTGSSGPAPSAGPAPSDYTVPSGGPLSAATAEPAGWPEFIPSGAAPGDVSSRAVTGQRRHPRRPGRGTGIAAVAVAVVVAAAVVGWVIVGHHGRPRAVASHLSPAGSPAGSPTFVRSHSPAVGVTGVAVAIAPGASQEPGAQQIAAFIGRYFTAINSHDYQLYAALFDQQMQESAQQFSDGYRSTVDSGATITGISAAAAGPAATVTFTSHQNPADAANHAACTNWDITLYLEQAGSGYLITRPPPGYHASQQPCS